MKKPSRRQVVWGVVGVVVVVLVVLALRPKPVEVDVAEVGRGALAVTVDEEGETRVRDRFVVSAPLAGRVLRIDLDPGDPVEAGRTVALIEPAAPALLDVRSRGEAEAAARAARAAVAGAQARLEQAQAERDQAAADLRRIERLAADGIVSEERLDQARTAARTSEEAVAAARAAVASARGELAAAEARLVQGGAGAGGEPVEVTAPVAGVILRRLRESESVVPAGEPLLEIADPDDLEIVSDLLSSDAVRVDAGDPVRIEQWGGDAVLEGTVRRVEPAGFTKVSALGVEEQRVNVVVDFADPRAAWRQLGDGYRVELAIVVWRQEDVVQVPTSALFRRPDGGEAAEGGEPWAVFVVADGTARRRDVVIGRKTGLHAQVLAGLEPGETVVVHPSDAVEEGTRVAARE
jgi:HlyD family secretion protein